MGMVGCGKTTLLHAIMGETSKQSGECTVRGSIAYVEQEPFIYSATIRDNVTFGRKFDEERFQGALKASQLANDIDLFARGADTTIGERGVNISGG